MQSRRLTKLKVARVAIIAIPLLFGSCGLGVDEGDSALKASSRGVNANCSYFEPIQERFWDVFRNPNLAVEGNEIAGWSDDESRRWWARLGTESLLPAAWPLVQDQTLQSIMKDMAEYRTNEDWLRNFESASSYCNLTPPQDTSPLVPPVESGVADIFSNLESTDD
jgi:hypothetical protein